MSSSPLSVSPIQPLDPLMQATGSPSTTSKPLINVMAKLCSRVLLRLCLPSTLPVNSGKIVCKAHVDKVGQKAMTLDPVGSGPYIFDTSKPQEKAILKRNAEYYGEQPYYDEKFISSR